MKHGEEKLGRNEKKYGTANCASPAKGRKKERANGQLERKIPKKFKQGSQGA